MDIYKNSFGNLLFLGPIFIHLTNFVTNTANHDHKNPY
jgi:hypothetical protein